MLEVLREVEDVEVLDVLLVLTLLVELLVVELEIVVRGRLLRSWARMSAFGIGVAVLVPRE